MHSLYFGTEPVLNRSATVDFYELFYTPQKEESSFVYESLLGKALGKIGTQLVLGRHKAFIKIDARLLQSDKIFTISNEFFILSLAADVQISEEVGQRVRSLKERGYILSLDNFAPSGGSMTKYANILDEVSFVKINFDQNILVNEDSQEIVARVKERGIGVVGTNISDKLKYELSKRLGCGFFQGYYFSKAKLFEEDEEYKPPRLNVLKLYSMLVSDADFDLITNEFKKNSSISVLLLKYINSGTFHFKNRISSIHQILTLIGREPLTKWLMLVIYSMSNLPNPKISPLMLMVKNRTELMERILKEIAPDASNSMLNQAYFVGVLSLIDVLFQQKLENILDEMNVDDIVRNALLHDDGILGEIYALVRGIEEFKPNSMIEFEQKHSLAGGTISKIVVECMQEVSIFEIALSSTNG